MCTGIAFPRSAVQIRQIIRGTSRPWPPENAIRNPEHYEDGLDVGDDESMYVGFDNDTCRVTLNRRSATLADGKTLPVRQRPSRQPQLLIATAPSAPSVTTLTRPVHRKRQPQPVNSERRCAWPVPRIFRSVGIPRTSRSTIGWIGVGIVLALGGCTKTEDRFAAETAAVKKLTEDYKVTLPKKDEDGHVIDVNLEGRRFDDEALIMAGQFLHVEGMSIQGSTITDKGLEKLPVLKNLARINIIARGVTDRGLVALQKMPSLKDVWLVETDTLTPSGRKSLEKTLPGIRLHVMNQNERKAQLARRNQQKS